MSVNMYESSPPLQMNNGQVVHDCKDDIRGRVKCTD